MPWVSGRCPALMMPHLARRFARRIIGLRDGGIIYDGPPDILTDDLLRELYRGDSVIRFDTTPADSRPLEVEVN